MPTSTLRLVCLLAVAVPVWAQPALEGADVAGTWELTGSANVPIEDALVFARLTITDDEIDAVYVFLDPDDGELSGRFERGRYVVSDGQLVVRENNQTSILEAERDGTFLEVRNPRSGSVLSFREVDPRLVLDPGLFGSWSGVRDGEPFAVRFRPDSRAEVREGDDLDEGDYLVAGPYLLLGDDPARYTFARSEDNVLRLVVEADGERTVLDRIGD
ncbi:hypothetical protein [Rubrivirga sp.]|uniref:hypothetical protein n=1 Tax=Rubrivirga sp. TaxID=1885344 RepID=UPI003C72FEB5